ncbi:hypothetical protein ABH991_001093 [Bradyrhizobium ottawaense]|uniref:DUF982 domain-containing protein n=1 Tax=Bradyrhizobium ottawaense TaxID=931866 RepID=A0ABV4FQC0_9BRAD
MGCQSRMLLGSALKPTSAVSGEQAVNPLDKEALLRLAGEWIKLAQNAEGDRRRE